MEVEPREDVLESSEDEADSFDNYGVFQSDYEFKFVQEGNDKTTLMLPPVTYDSMEVKYFNIEIEVDSELHVSALEKEETLNGTTRFFFRIAKERLQLSPVDDEVSEKLGEDGYEYEEMTDVAEEKAEKAKKRKAKKPRTAMDAHNYSKPKVVMTSAPSVKVEEESEEIEKAEDEALDGTQLDQDTSNLEEVDDGEEEFDEGEDMDDDGDDDMDDFDEIEIGENMTLAEEEEEDDPMKTPKRKGTKAKVVLTSDKKRRKYDRTNHYSKNSSNFSLEYTEEGKRVFKCGTCDYISKWPGNMRDHVRVHTGERPFQCEICQKGFGNQSGLQKHMSVHTDDRPHSCDICGFSFKIKRQLVKHYRRHLTPGSVLCPVCGKHFYSNSELQHHMPTHTGERKFICNVCSKTFTSVSSLGRHKSLHTGAKFECHICGHLSMRKEYWRSHMIKAHQFDENDELLAKRNRFSRLYEQTEQLKIPSVHTIRVVKTEPVKPDSEVEIVEDANGGERVIEIEPGEEVSDEHVQYIISLDY